MSASDLTSVMEFNVNVNGGTTLYASRSYGKPLHKYLPTTVTNRL